jgi:hypothetical protein
MGKFRKLLSKFNLYKKVKLLWQKVKAAGGSPARSDQTKHFAQGTQFRVIQNKGSK